MFEHFLKALILVTALSVDSFTSGFAYGVSKTRMPLLSVFIVAFISSITLVFSLLLGSMIQGIIPPGWAAKISFTILFLLGLVKLFNCSKHNEAEKANKDGDDLLSPVEAISLGAALSIDSVAAGIGAGFVKIMIPAAFIASLLIGAAALILGSKLGHIISNRFRANLDWVSGVLLMLLAVMKLFE